MRNFIDTMALLFALAIFAGAARAQDNTQGDGSVSFQTFYDQLANAGTWVKTSQYGDVWQPTENDPNWRPYMYGHWVNTDQGMTWDSDEPFGWAVYHYGRWTNLAGYGWVWVPGYTWAPAWVSWREGDSDVGWAPLPPASDEGIDYYNDDDYFTGFELGFHIGDDCDLAYGIGPAWYTFCPISYIGDYDCWRHFRPYGDNFGFIGRTRNVTNINFHRDGQGRFGRVRAEGPSVAALNARARTPIREASLVAATRRGEAGLHGQSLAVYAPRVDASTIHSARPARVDATLANAAVNRGTNIDQPLAVNSHLRGVSPTAGQIRAADEARGADARARVATSATAVTRGLDQPLTSMRTTTRAAAVSGRALAPSGYADSAFRGRREVGSTLSSAHESALTGGGLRPQVTESAAPAFRSGQPSTLGEDYRHSSVFSSAPPLEPRSAFERSAPAVSGEPSFRSSEPVFHSSASAFHESFHAMAPAPAPHFSGGGFSGGGFRGAPSGGGFHAAAPSGGGFHAAAPSGGGGHAGGPGGRR